MLTAALLMTSSHSEGQVSVFLSSPFKGIEEERSLFALRELPRLQRKCEARGVHLRVLDLRWGISNKQKDDQELLNICLKEIDHADFFIGFHATRYGTTYDPANARTEWVLDNVKKCAKQFPWLWKVLDRSLTEMEYMHGWLNRPVKSPLATDNLLENTDGVGAPHRCSLGGGSLQPSIYADARCIDIDMP